MYFFAQDCIFFSFDAYYKIRKKLIIKTHYQIKWEKLCSHKFRSFFFYYIFFYWRNVAAFNCLNYASKIRIFIGIGKNHMHRYLFLFAWTQQLCTNCGGKLTQIILRNFFVHAHRHDAFPLNTFPQVDRYIRVCTFVRMYVPHDPVK